MTIPDDFKKYLNVKCDFIDKCYITRDSQVLKDLLLKIDQTTDEINKHKTLELESGNESNANLLLAIDYFFGTIYYEASMWIKMKESDPNNAWNDLISAQECIDCSLYSMNIPEFEQRKYSRKLEAIEALIFPPQHFLSPWFVVESISCSICNRDYSDPNCQHIEFRPYRGELCFRKFTIKNIIHLAKVSHPADKRRRVVSISQDKENWRDLMTLGTVKEIIGNNKDTNSEVKSN